MPGSGLCLEHGLMAIRVTVNGRRLIIFGYLPDMKFINRRIRAGNKRRLG